MRMLKEMNPTSEDEKSAIIAAFAPVMQHRTCLPIALLSLLLTAAAVAVLLWTSQGMPTGVNVQGSVVQLAQMNGTGSSMAKQSATDVPAEHQASSLSEKIPDQETQGPSQEGAGPTEEEEAVDEVEEDAMVLEEEPVDPSDFEDVDWDAWYAPYVGPIIYWGIASGYGNSDGSPAYRFGPGDQVTVAQFMKMAIRSARIDTSTCRGAKQSSTLQHWVAPYLVCTQALGARILQNRTDIDRPILRGEAISFLHDVFQTDVPPLASAFRDTTYHPYRSDIAFAAARQIVSGTTDARGRPTGFFLPRNPLTRAEAAKILYLMIHTERRSEGESLDPVTLELHAKNYEFLPTTLVIRQRQPVILRVRNQGLHTFTIEELKMEYILKEPEETVTFSVPKAGTFRFTCTVPGHAEAGMIGTLIVK